MIATGHPEVSIERRCQLLSLPRASYYRGPASGLRQGDLELMRRIDAIYLEHPGWEYEENLPNGSINNMEEN